MHDHGSVVLGASEGATADIAWIVIYTLCWILMAAPFVLWYAARPMPPPSRRTRPRCPWSR